MNTDTKVAALACPLCSEVFESSERKGNCPHCGQRFKVEMEWQIIDGRYYPNSKPVAKESHTFTNWLLIILLALAWMAGINSLILLLWVGVSYVTTLPAIPQPIGFIAGFLFLGFCATAWQRWLWGKKQTRAEKEQWAE